MPHFFISYCKQDTRQLALALNDALNALPDTTAWVDESLKFGQSWELQIQHEIDRCDVMIVLYSPDINRHKEGKKPSYVLNEIRYALHLEKRIIPVMAQQTNPPLSLILEQYIDYVSDSNLANLVTKICKDVGISATVAPPIEPAPAPQITIPTPPPPKTPTTAELAAAIRAIIGDPFDLCDVPAGDFLYGLENDEWAASPQKLYLPAFAIGKYPITYAQFQVFIDAKDGFYNDKWWEGLAADAEHRQQPGKQAWKIATHPRERVSWYDAVAFTHWLSSKSGFMVTLPTEFQWEKAARGTDGRNYPWGDMFDKAKCNTEKAGIGQTTPVDRYPQGASPYGVWDMSGNVWEWCLNEFDDPQTDVKSVNMRSNAGRGLRGGSWYSNPGFAHATSRVWDNPYTRDDSFGFRLLCLPHLSAR